MVPLSFAFKNRKCQNSTFLLGPAIKYIEMSLKLNYSQPNIRMDGQENIVMVNTGSPLLLR